MSKIWLVSADHSGVALGLHMKDEGHDVCLAMVKPEDRHGKHEKPKDDKQSKEWAKKEKYLRQNAEGLLPKRWLPGCLKDIGKDDYIIDDQVYGYQFCDALRRQGYRVLGGSEVGYRLEHDRDKTLRWLKSLGYDLPMQQKFGAHSSKTAIKFLEGIKDKMLFVLKSDNPLVVTQVAHESNDELCQKLAAEASEIDKEPFLLQQKVEGTEFACETWYSNGIPILSNLDIEDKRKYSESCEVQTGCSYDLLWMLPVDHPLRMRVNGPLDKFAAKEIKTGLLDISVIYEPKEDKMYALEVCGSRFAYNAFYSMLSLLNVPVGGFLTGVLNGKYKADIGEKIFEKKYACGLRVFNDDKTPEQMITFPKEMQKDVWLWDAQKKGGKLLTVGDEAVGILTSQGENPESAMAEMRKKFAKFSMPTAWARDDYDEEDEPGYPLARFHRMESMQLI